MKNRNMLRASLLIAAFAGLAFNANAVVFISELTWNDALNGNVTSSSGDGGTNADIDIDRESTLVSFKAGAGDYSNFVLANSTNGAGTAGLTPYWGINAPNLTAGDDALSATDNRLDTGMVNISNAGNDFGFPSSPTGLDEVLFVFDVGSADGPIDFVLIDGVGGGTVGNTLLNVNSNATTIADIDFERVNGGGTTTTLNTPVKGLAFTFSEFGLTAGQLSSVAGVRFINGSGFDPALVGFTAIPEPSQAALLFLGAFALLGCRRR